eukprot:3499461-Pyramimonas_sp.AAC.1
MGFLDFEAPWFGPRCVARMGGCGFRYSVVWPWQRVLRNQTRAQLFDAKFLLLLLLWSWGGSKEAQGASKKPQ